MKKIDAVRNCAQVEQRREEELDARPGLDQAKEEQDHALLMYRYLQNNGEKVTFEAVAKPDKTFEKLIDPLKEGLAHEKYVTSLINTIYEAAQESKDFRTTQFLDWFVKEQGEEEKNSMDQITRMELFGDDARSLYMLNSELAACPLFPISAPSPLLK